MRAEVGPRVGVKASGGIRRDVTNRDNLSSIEGSQMPRMAQPTAITDLVATGAD